MALSSKVITSQPELDDLNRTVGINDGIGRGSTPIYSVLCMFFPPSAIELKPALVDFPVFRNERHRMNPMDIRTFEHAL